MTILLQSEWHGLIAAYLFLGGLGGGLVALGAFADLLFQPNTADADRRPGLFAAALGVAALAVGSVFLVLDLENPWAAIYALSNPRSWITWGVLFITLFMLLSAGYGLPYLLGRKVAAAWQRRAGLAAGVLGLLVAVYTGFLLSSSTGVFFWNNPALPVLFLVSGVSTGAALLMIYLAAARQTAFSQRLLHGLERIDVGLIAAELVVLFAFATMSWTGCLTVKESARAMFGSAGFLIGVPLLGLVVPLALEWFSLKRHRPGPALTVAAAALVLVGGALLRVYILQAGYWGYPFPQ